MSQLTCVKTGVTYKFDDLSKTHTKEYLLKTFESTWENNTFLTFLHVATRYDKKIAIDIAAYIGLTAPVDFLAKNVWGSLLFEFE